MHEREAKEERNEQEEEKEAAAKTRCKAGGRIDMALALQQGSLSELSSSLQATHDRLGPLRGKGTEIEPKPSAEFNGWFGNLNAARLIQAKYS